LDGNDGAEFGERRIGLVCHRLPDDLGMRLQHPFSAPGEGQRLDASGLAQRAQPAFNARQTDGKACRDFRLSQVGLAGGGKDPFTPIGGVGIHVVQCITVIP
jgi:hypothetical protein